MPGTKLKGTIDFNDAERPRFTLDLDADKLDLDKLREALADDPGAAKKPDDNPHGLSRDARALRELKMAAA